MLSVIGTRRRLEGKACTHFGFKYLVFEIPGGQPDTEIQQEAKREDQ